MSDVMVKALAERKIIIFVKMGHSGLEKAYLEEQAHLVEEEGALQEALGLFEDLEEEQLIRSAVV